MAIKLGRRSFLKQTALVALTLRSFGGVGKVLARDTKVHWAVGCRDVHLRMVNKADAWQALKDLEADCFEADIDDDLALGSFAVPGRKYTLSTPDGIAMFSADLQANRRKVGALCMHNKFDQRLEKEIELCVTLAEAAEQLGVQVIRIDVVPRALNIEEFPAFAIKACRRLCDATSGSKVRFAIENHGKATNDPGLMEQILDGVACDRLGVTLDTANLYWWGHPLDEIYSIYERFAPRTFHTHCKNIRYPENKRNVKRQMGWEYGKFCCPVYEGDIDFKRVLAILQKAGYQGTLCVENESLSRFPESDRASILKREIAFLRDLG